jgi:hypothetical protein
VVCADAAGPPTSDPRVMRNHERDRLQAEESRALAELRRAEERMAASERELERKLHGLDADIVEAEDTIDAYLRAGNRGRKPEHPLKRHGRQRP